MGGHMKKKKLEEKTEKKEVVRHLLSVPSITKDGQFHAWRGRSLGLWAPVSLSLVYTLSESAQVSDAPTPGPKLSSQKTFSIFA